jgi:hypothetical protein
LSKVSDYQTKKTMSALATLFTHCRECGKLIHSQALSFNEEDGVSLDDSFRARALCTKKHNTNKTHKTCVSAFCSDCASMEMTEKHGWHDVFLIDDVFVGKCPGKPVTAE